MTDEYPVQPPGAGSTPGQLAAGAAGGGGASGQPPLFTAFAWRHGLVRPARGRVLAGVSGALARATNTDPILWRVVFVVLAIFGGIGLLAYLLGWLLLPADADTASPVEALAGRGQSRTSTIATVIGIVLLVIALGSVAGEPHRGPFGTAMFVGTFLAVFVAGTILLLVLLLRDRGRVGPPGPGPIPGQPGDVPAQLARPGQFASPATSAAGTPPYAPDTTPPVPPRAAPPYPPGGPLPPRRPRPPGSSLGLLVLSLALVAIGVLALVDLFSGRVPAAGYFALALAVVGLGLVTGAWFGRARGLITVGVFLAIALGIASAADARVSGGNVTWAPASVEQLAGRYHHGVGDATLDLSAIDFATATKKPIQIDVDIDLGNLTVIVPGDVDVAVDAGVDVGNANVFGKTWGGINPDNRTITDLGSDGAGGGQLAIDARVNVGNLEVHR